MWPVDVEQERTTLVLPVPEAAGVVPCPHITLLDPFLPAASVDEGVLAELREFFAALVPFPFVLGEQTRFPGGGSYLPPEPLAVFRRVIHELRRAFPELAGPATTLDTFVPHLRVDEGIVVPGAVEAHARETQLWIGGPDGGRLRASFEFGTSAA